MGKKYKKLNNMADLLSLAKKVVNFRRHAITDGTKDTIKIFKQYLEFSIIKIIKQRLSRKLIICPKLYIMVLEVSSPSRIELNIITPIMLFLINPLSSQSINNLVKINLQFYIILRG